MIVLYFGDPRSQNIIFVGIDKQSNCLFFFPKPQLILAETYRLTTCAIFFR